MSRLSLRFNRFVRQHSFARHFARSAVLSDFPDDQQDAFLAAESLPSLVQAAQLNAPDLLARLESHANGLSDLAAKAIRQRVGSNSVREERPLPGWLHLWHCYRNPFNLLLSVLATISWYTGDNKATVVIGTMVVISTMVRFIQELRSSQAVDALKAMVSNNASVLRQSAQPVSLPIQQLVPGDVVLLSAGDMVPADLRVLQAKDLFINQSTMTGESLPVEKFGHSLAADQVRPGGALELNNLCFMGTNVVSGSATAVVVHTGEHTLFGALAEKIAAQPAEDSAFQIGVNQVSWLLIRFMLIMTPLVFLINGLTKHDWLEAFLFALSVAVGLTPEMLPMIVTTTLAKGAILLSRKKVIVKRLDAIQNFGAMDVLCTDKTGTLTQDKIILERHIDAWGAPSEQVLGFAYLNSYHQTGLKNLLDVAVLKHAEVDRILDGMHRYSKVDEIPFDFVRRRMSVVVSEDQDHHELICKGALEEVLSVCTQVQHGAQVEGLSPEYLATIHQLTAELNGDGLRVVAVAMKALPRSERAYGVADETELTLMGFVAFLDPPKETTAPALQALQQHGISVKVLTGDNELVTAKICRDVGQPVQGLLLGAAIDAMLDPELAQAVEHTTVFAKLTPTHKERIVRMLRSNGHVVGFMGDGINDAPALRAADIGISVDSAVDIAKEAADIILLEKSLMVLKDGVLEGRKTFANMLKYIRMTASSNFGNVLSVLVASVFLPFLPMLPLHLLVQNLMYDFSQVAIPFDQVDAPQIAQPLRWQPQAISRFMFCFGPISSLFDLLTFALMWWVFAANTTSQQTLFQSGWFIEGLISQTLIVHMIRTPLLPFLQSRAAWPLMLTSAAIVTVGIFLPMGLLAHYFKLQALPLSYFPWLGLIVAAYLLLAQTIKVWFRRRYGWQ